MSQEKLDQIKFNAKLMAAKLRKEQLETSKSSEESSTSPSLSPRDKFFGWIDLDDEWDRIVACAEKIKATAKNYPTSKKWSPEREIIGVAGELAFALATKRTFNWEKRCSGKGDGGLDFPGIDVKGTKWWRKPHLRVGIHNKDVAAYFVLVGVDLEKHRAQIKGYASRQMVKDAPIIDDDDRGKPYHRIEVNDLVRTPPGGGMRE